MVIREIARKTVGSIILCSTEVYCFKPSIMREAIVPEIERENKDGEILIRPCG